MRDLEALAEAEGGADEHVEEDPDLDSPQTSGQMSPQLSPRPIEVPMAAPLPEGLGGGRPPEGDFRYMKAAFQMLDTKNEGFLDREQARNFLRCAGWCLPSEELDAILDCQSPPEVHKGSARSPQGAQSPKSPHDRRSTKVLSARSPPRPSIHLPAPGGPGGSRRTVVQSEPKWKLDTLLVVLQQALSLSNVSVAEFAQDLKELVGGCNDIEPNHLRQLVKHESSNSDIVSEEELELVLKTLGAAGLERLSCDTLACGILEQLAAPRLAGGRGSSPSLESSHRASVKLSML